MIDEALAQLDRIAIRVTASTLTGLGCGLAYSTYKGFPILKTSISTATSFALISTACFGMERVANIMLCQSSAILYNSNDDDSDFDEKRIEPNDTNDGRRQTASIQQQQLPQPTINPKIHYTSHTIGGLFGGSIVGFLFQGKPLAGAFLLTPIMLCIGKLEVKLDEYKVERLQQLIADSSKVEIIGERDKNGGKESTS